MRSIPLVLRRSRFLAALTLLAGSTGTAFAGELAYSSFLGGTVEDRAYAIAVDASNSAYLTGKTASNLFPGAAGNYQPGNTGGASDAFVTKINPAGTAVLWSTYYGGAGDDIGKGIGVDGTGKVYITGSTTGSLPGEALLGVGGGPTDGFVAAFSDTGATLLYAKRFGGASAESSNGIAVDAAGNVYLTGQTTSMAADSFPYTFSGGPLYTAGAAQTTGGGAEDAFVLKFSAAGGLVYGTYLGGTNLDHGNAIAVDGGGNAYITGQCEDAFVSAAVYPTVFKNTVTGPTDAFIAKLDPTGATFLYKTYVGGGGGDEATGIALDSANNAYITGWTNSGDFPGMSFVTVGQTTLIGNPDAFVFKLRTAKTGSSDGVYATYLGGSGDSRGKSIAVDGAGNAYVTGITYAGDFPRVGPLSGGGTLVGTFEAFVTKVSPTGGSFDFSTYLGGTVETGGQGIALDGARNIYVAGWTSSPAATFPTKIPFQAANAGTYDAFVAKIGAPAPAPACRLILDPGVGFAVGGTTVTITGFPDISVSTASVTFGGVPASYTVNASSTVITAFSPRHPLIGPLALGSVTLAVKTLTSGTCSVTYSYVSAADEEIFFPSPATEDTGHFKYDMAMPGMVKIRIYNIVGDLASKIEESKAAGTQFSSVNTGRLAPGVYLYRVERNYNNGTSATSGVKKFVVKH
jgi:hypothetical protein